MGFNLKNFLEEKIADVNPFDGGQTAQTVRANRVKPAPAQTVTRPKQQLQVGSARPGNISLGQPKPQRLTIAPVARPTMPKPAPVVQQDPLKQLGKITGDINKATLGTGVDIAKGLAGIAQRAGTTVGQAGVGLYGAADTASSLIGGDKTGARRKNRDYVQAIDKMGQGTAIDGGNTSFLTKEVRQGKASPVEFGKQFTNAGVETSSLVPAGRVLSGVQKVAGFNPAIAKNILATNAKQAGVFGTATTANDALQGREINAQSLAMNYGAPFALGAGAEFGGVALAKGAKGTGKVVKDVNQKIEQTNPRVKELDMARVNMQRAFDVEKDPVRRAQINKGLAQLTQERQSLTQGGYVRLPGADDLSVDAVKPAALRVPEPQKISPRVTQTIDELNAAESAKPTLKEAGRYVQSTDFVPEGASGKLVRKAQTINKRADEAIKAAVRTETKRFLDEGMPLGQARNMAEDSVLSRPDLQLMQENRVQALKQAIEEDSVKRIDVKGPKEGKVTEFVAAQNQNDAGGVSYDLIPLDKEKHTLRNGMVVDKTGRSVGSYVGIDENGNHFAYVEGKPVNINKIIGDVEKWGNVNKAFTDMDRLIEINAPDKQTARQVQEFTTVYKDRQEAQMKTYIAKRREELQAMENEVLSKAPKHIKKDELYADLQRMGENQVDMNLMAQKYGQDFMDNTAVPFLKWVRNFYDSTLDSTNSVLVRNGFDEIPRRENYITHISEDPSFWAKVGIGIQDLNPFGSSVTSDINPGKVRGGVPDAIVGNTDVTGARRRYNPFAQERKGYDAKQDIFASLDAYIEPMAFNQFMTPAASRARIVERVFRTYEKAKDIKMEQLAEIVGLDEARKLQPKYTPHANFKADRRSPLVLAWQEYGNMLAGKTNKLDRKIMELGEGSSQFMDTSVKAQGIVGASSIPGSTTAALAQVLSVPQTIARDSATSVLKASRDMLTFSGKRLGADDPLRHSSFMRARYTDATTRRKTSMQKYLKGAAKPMELIEREMGEFSWRSAYHEAIKKGQKGQEAVRTADIVAKKTLAGRGIGDRPVAMNSKALGIVTQFGLEVNNMRVQFWNDFTPKQKIKFAVAATALNTVYGGMTGQTPLPDYVKAALDTYNDITDSSDDSKDSFTDNLQQGGQRILGQTSKFVPGASTVAGIAMSDRDREKTFGKNSDLSRFGTPAATRVVDAGFDALGAATTGDFGKLGESVASVIPTGSQIKRTAQGADALNKGYITDSKGNVQNVVDKDNPLTWAQGLLFGKYALPGQQQAMNKNQKLTEKQTENFKTLYATDKKAAAEYFNSVTGNKANNERKGTLTDTGANKVGATSSVGSALALKEENKARNEKLNASFSPEDLAIAQLSVADQQKLVDSGVYTQAKIDGVNKYEQAKRKELGYEDSSSSKEKSFKTEYKELEAKIKSPESKKWSAVERAKKEKDLKYLSVKKDYDKDTVGLYHMSKTDAYNLVSTDKNGKAMVEKILKYGDALVEAGLSTKNKYRDKNGNILLNAPGTKSGGKGKGRGGKKSAKGKFDYKLFGFSGEGKSNSKQLYDLLKSAKLKANIA